MKSVNYQSPNAKKYFHGHYILKPAEGGGFVEKASKVVAKAARENNRNAFERSDKIVIA